MLRVKMLFLRRVGRFSLSQTDDWCLSIERRLANIEGSLNSFVVANQRTLQICIIGAFLLVGIKLVV